MARKWPGEVRVSLGARRSQKNKALRIIDLWRMRRVGAGSGSGVRVRCVGKGVGEGGDWRVGRIRNSSRKGCRWVENILLR